MIIAFAILAAVASHAVKRKQGNLKTEMEFRSAKLQLINATVLKISSGYFQSVVDDEYEVPQIQSIIISKDLRYRLFENEADGKTEKAKENCPLAASCLSTAGSTTMRKSCTVSYSLAVSYSTYSTANAMSNVRASFGTEDSTTPLLGSSSTCPFALTPHRSTAASASMMENLLDTCNTFKESAMPLLGSPSTCLVALTKADSASAMSNVRASFHTSTSALFLLSSAACSGTSTLALVHLDYFAALSAALTLPATASASAMENMGASFDPNTSTILLLSSAVHSGTWTSGAVHLDPFAALLAALAPTTTSTTVMSNEPASFNLNYSVAIWGSFAVHLPALASVMNNVRNCSNMDDSTAILPDYSGTCPSTSPITASASGMVNLHASFDTKNSAVLNLAYSTANSGHIKATAPSTASSRLISKLLPPHRIIFPFSTLAHMPMAATLTPPTHWAQLKTSCESSACDIANGGCTIVLSGDFGMGSYTGEISFSSKMITIWGLGKVLDAFGGGRFFEATGADSFLELRNAVLQNGQAGVSFALCFLPI
jgi:hypothetical protein